MSKVTSKDNNRTITKFDSKRKFLGIIIVFILATPFILPLFTLNNAKAENQTIAGTEEVEGFIEHHETASHEMQVQGASLVTFTLEWSESDTDLDLRITGSNGQRTGGFSLSTQEIPGSDYSGWSSKPEVVNVESPADGTWEIEVYAYEGSSAYTLTVEVTGTMVIPDELSQPPVGVQDTLTFSGSLDEHGLGGPHTFDVSASISELEVTMFMAVGVDFDLRLEDSSGRYTGGFDSLMNEIPDADYNGWSSRPEVISVESPDDGTWTLHVYAYAGGGSYSVQVELTPTYPNEIPDTSPPDLPTSGPTIHYVKLNDIAVDPEANYFEMTIGLPSDEADEADSLRSMALNMGYILMTDEPQKITISVSEGYKIMYILPVNQPQPSRTLKLTAWVGSQLLAMVDTVGFTNMLELMKILREREGCTTLSLEQNTPGTFIVKVEKTGYTSQTPTITVGVALRYESSPTYTGTPVQDSYIQALASYQYGIPIE